MATTSSTDELTPNQTTQRDNTNIFRAFSKSIRRNATVSALHNPTQVNPIQTQTCEIQKLSNDFITQRLQLQNSHLAILAKDREISNLHYWLNGRGQQTGDLVFRIGELMKMGQEAESEIVELEGELDELKEGLGKAVREVLRLREVVEGKGGLKGEGEGGDAVGEKKSVVFAEALRLESVVDAARLHIRYQDQRLEDLEGKIERDSRKMLELEKDRHETWRYAQGVDDDLEAAEAENEELKDENEKLKGVFDGHESELDQQVGSASRLLVIRARANIERKTLAQF
ncbi:hypothetical protein LTR27_001251 [Elasticomyces elasticus]|nr:hypothetical protein LTR27_001251 [Elasticomyces elasticus]